MAVAEIKVKKYAYNYKGEREETRGSTGSLQERNNEGKSPHHRPRRGIGRGYRTFLFHIILISQERYFGVTSLEKTGQRFTHYHPYFLLLFH